MADEITTPLKRAREAKGLSQEQLARLVGSTQPQIGRLERNQRELSVQWAKRLAPHLGIPAQELIENLDFLAPSAKAALSDFEESRKTLPAHYRAEPELLGRRDLKLFTSVEGGPGELMVFSTEPYDILPRPWYVQNDPDAFAVVLAGESMEPIYEAGEIIVASPRTPLVKGKEAIFVAEPHGDFRASLKRYRGQTESDWLAKQFNPEKDLKLSKGVWQKAYRVLGSFDG